MRVNWIFAWLTAFGIVHGRSFSCHPIGAMALALSNLGVRDRRHEIQANILDRRAQRYPRFSISLPCQSRSVGRYA